jgi:hypothetical protein
MMPLVPDQRVPLCLHRKSSGLTSSDLRTDTSDLDHLHNLEVRWVLSPSDDQIAMLLVISQRAKLLLRKRVTPWIGWCRQLEDTPVQRRPPRELSYQIARLEGEARIRVQAQCVDLSRRCLCGKKRHLEHHSNSSMYCVSCYI